MITVWESSKPSLSCLSQMYRKSSSTEEQFQSFSEYLQCQLLVHQEQLLSICLLVCVVLLGEGSSSGCALT